MTVDELFTVPLDQFVAERDKLARELKKAGDADGAAEVKAMRKPTVSAWGVNQAVRAAPDAVDALIDAGRAVREAQRKAVEGGGSAELRDAMKRLRSAVAALAGVAQRYGADTAAQLEKVTATLQ